MSMVGATARMRTSKRRAGCSGVGVRGDRTPCPPKTEHVIASIELSCASTLGTAHFPDQTEEVGTGEQVDAETDLDCIEDKKGHDGQDQDFEYEDRGCDEPVGGPTLPALVRRAEKSPPVYTDEEDTIEASYEPEGEAQVEEFLRGRPARHGDNPANLVLLVIVQLVCNLGVDLVEEVIRGAVLGFLHLALRRRGRPEVLVDPPSIADRSAQCNLGFSGEYPSHGLGVGIPAALGET